MFKPLKKELVCVSKLPRVRLSWYDRYQALTLPHTQHTISEKTPVIDCLGWTCPQVHYSHTRKLQHNQCDKVVGVKVWWFCKIEVRKLSHSYIDEFKGQAAILESEEENKAKRVRRIGAPLLSALLFVRHSSVSCYDWLLCIGLNQYNI